MRSEWRVGRRHLARFILGVVMVSLLAGCGGTPGTPTPLPATLVRPEQPTPVYPESMAFTLITPTLSLPVVAIAPTTALPLIDAEATPVAPELAQMAAQLPSPTGIGIVRGGAALLAIPNGAVRQQLPAGAVVTLTGKSADGAWVAAYDDQGISGWLAAQQLVLLGTETLTVVTTASGPGLAATLVAQAMEPMVMPTIVLTETVAP